MAGRKGMKAYPKTIKEKVRQEIKAGSSQRAVSQKYGISRYSIQSRCGLRPETRIRQIAPLPKGQRKAVKTIEDYKRENTRLRMENELLRDFLRLTGRK